jgi:MoaA/NifB/PqqE/SkfB family radical SAM enzyme
MISTSDFVKPLVNQALNYLQADPVGNLPKLIGIAEKLATQENHKKQVRDVGKAVLDPNSNWRELAIRLLTETHPNIMKGIGVNFFVNSALVGVPKQYRLAEDLGVDVPYAILMDPTEKCNLRCIGCWAGDYQRVRELPFETMDRVCTEAEELGIHLIVVSGGEPMVAKDKLIRLAERHPNQLFHPFTNGTLIDEEFVSEMVRLGNIAPAISVEGLEEQTDARRGKGVYQKIMHTMDLLREAGCVFGFSACYARNNTEIIASDEFIDTMVDKGCAFGWLFTYVPVGSDPNIELMATPEQRGLMYDTVRRWRNSKPIFIVDFWNDGEFSLGCIAGGRRYLHINANGDVEPCAFIHYAVDNINDKSLKECLASSLMKAYQKRQPFNENMLRPCPLIDNPEKLVEIIEESGARSTQLGEHHVNPKELAEMIEEGYTRHWAEKADEIWNRDSHEFYEMQKEFYSGEGPEDPRKQA